MYKTDTNALRVAMAKNGITSIESLSAMSGICSRTLGSVLRGDSQPSTKVIYALMSTLSIEPSEAGNIFFAK